MSSLSGASLGSRTTTLTCVNWMHLAQVRDQWRTFTNTVMKLRVPQKAGSFLTCWVTV